jgi:hypothetical protein
MVMCAWSPFARMGAGCALLWGALTGVGWSVLSWLVIADLGCYFSLDI